MNPASTDAGRSTPYRSELAEIGRRFEVALRHPFHSADRDPGQVEMLRRRGRRLLERQVRHGVERRRGLRNEKPGSFSLARLRDRLTDKLRSLKSRQETTPPPRASTQ